MVENLTERVEKLERKLEKEKTFRNMIEGGLIFLIGLLYIVIGIVLLLINSEIAGVIPTSFKLGNVDISKSIMAIGLGLAGSAVLSIAVDSVKAVKKLLYFDWKFRIPFVAITGIWIISAILNFLYDLPKWFSLFVKITGITFILLVIELLIEVIIYTRKHKNELPQEKWEW